MTKTQFIIRCLLFSVTYSRRAFFLSRNGIVGLFPQNYNLIHFSKNFIAKN
jgi:hypothetical protein